MGQALIYPRYDSYKNSGLDWLGEIPSGWDLKRLGAVFEERKEKVSDKDFPPLSVTKKGILPQLASAAKSDDGDNRKGVRAGDFVINSRSDRKGSSGVAKNDGSVSLINIVLKPQGIDPRYCEHLLKSNGFIEEFYRMGHGIVADLWTTKYWDMKSIQIPLPDLETQQRISNFLDQKTAEIDEAIAKKQRLIELLKEQKAILINQAVTKGLSFKVPMRDSGVGWMGAIPSHWSTHKLKHIVKFSSGGTPSKNNSEYWGGPIPWVSPKDMKQRYLSSSIDSITEKAVQRTTIKLLRPGCVLIVVRGMILAKKVPVALSTAPLTINQDMKALVTSECCLPEYLLYLLDGLHEELSSLLEESGHGTKTLPTEKLGNFILPLPPLEEQQGIIARVKDVDLRISHAISITGEQIKTLIEMKQTFIASAVTGKIKV